MVFGQWRFYLTFKGGKKELYQKSLNRVWKLSKNQFAQGAKQAENPLEFIKVFFLSMADRTSDQNQKGCYAGNTLVESSYVDEELKELAISLLKEFEVEFEKALKLAQEMGLLSEEKSPQVLANYLLNLWNGINVTLRMDPDKDSYKSMIEMNLKVLD